MRKPKKLEEEPMEEEGEAIACLADAVADYWQQFVDSGSDPFDNYVYHCHAKICADRNAFAGRLRRGYRRLVQQLSQNQNID